MEIKIAEKITVNNPKNVAEVLQKILKTENLIDQDKEHFWVIGLNTRNVVKYLELVSLGTLDANLVHPREVFRFAVMKAVASVIVAHYHPSGGTEPSADDLAITRRLEEAGKILGIEILDHLIITKNTYYSFKDKGLIK